MTTDRLFTRKAVVIGVSILLASVAVGIIFRHTPLGNIVGVVGVAVSILGFVVTIWTVLDAREQIRQAGIRAEEAITRSREDARQRIEGIAEHFLAAHCADLRRCVEDLRQAAQDATWSRAIYRCQECRHLAHLLSPH